MRKQRDHTLVNVILTFFLVLFLAHHASASNAINFKFIDTNGKTHTLSSYKGKWVLVNFWAPWCPRCKMEFAPLNTLDARTDFVVIGVGMDYGVDRRSVLDTMSRYNIRFPIILGTERRDPSSPANQVGPVDYYPTSYLYDPSGRMVMFIPGIISLTRLEAAMKQYKP